MNAPSPNPPLNVIRIIYWRVRFRSPTFWGEKLHNRNSVHQAVLPAHANYHGRPGDEATPDHAHQVSYIRESCWFNVPYSLHIMTKKESTYSPMFVPNSLSYIYVDSCIIVFFSPSQLVTGYKVSPIMQNVAHSSVSRII